jgi:prevent-host-death family protein
MLVMRVGLRELNQQTAQLMARVKMGETLEITERGRVFAIINPVQPTGSKRLDELIEAGRARPPRGRFRRKDLLERVVHDEARDTDSTPDISSDREDRF